MAIHKILDSTKKLDKGEQHFLRQILSRRTNDKNKTSIVLS